jgi:hypothetical protein
MIREFLFRAYLVAFAGSVILGLAAGWGRGEFFTGVGIGLAVSVFWLIVGWICQPLFRNK